MKDLRLFGTEAYPLHPSALSATVECPWRAVMAFLFTSDDDHGVAGDTGSAMHRAAREYHRGATIAAALGAMQEGTPEYPLADLSDAANLFLKYAADVRNSGAEIVLNEQNIAFEISPAPEDPTGAPILINGRLDQVRVADDRLVLVDIKTTKKDPHEMMAVYAMQQAAYMVGASVLLKKPVEAACLLYPRQYKANPSSSLVFYHYPWTLKDCEHILKGVRHVVARIRSGDVWHNPNANCHWCAARTPDLCLPKLQELKLRATA